MRWMTAEWQNKARIGLTSIAGVVAVIASLDSLASGGEPPLTAKQSASSVTVFAGKQPVASYVFGDDVFADDKIARPFYAHVFTSDGIAVTRNHPPKAGEPADHADMHPGIWLAFGDLSGHDFWRNKGRVRHVEFLAEPKAEENRISFSVRNEYVVPLQGGEKRIANETCRHTWRLQDGNLLLTLDSEFASADPTQPLLFGDQEEMGLGVRVASPLRVKDAGGEIRTSAGQRNEKEAWGQQAQWCDYRSTMGGREVGIALMTHPDNFRASWFHVRDYGLMVANPFGQNAFTGKEKSRVEVKPGEKLRLRFGVWIHTGKEMDDKTPSKAYTTYLVNAESRK
ncbi:MAG: PmoA family protein [Pirellulaceae bacterium]